MHSTPARSRRQDAAPILLALLLLGGAGEARAQSVPVVKGFETVTFKSASVNEDGYIHANLVVDYAFRVCGGNVRLLYGVRPGSAQGSTTYWYKGHNYGSAETPIANHEPPFRAEFSVSFGAERIYVHETQDPRIETDLGCGFGSQWIGLGPVSKYDKDAKTPRQIQDVLNRFSFDIGITRQPMRNLEVERLYAQQIAAAKQKATQDSANAQRAAKARADSVARAKVASAEKARSDSIARARSASRPTTPLGGATGAAGAASSAAGSSTSASRPAATPRSDTPRYAANDAAAQRARAEQQRRDSLQRAGEQARARLQAEMDARSEATNRSIRESNEREAQQSAAIDAAFAPLQAQAREYAQARAEREEAQRERNAELYRQRRTAHFAAAEEAFTNAPWRPSCRSMDMQGTLPLDGAVSGVLTLETCRTSSGAAAAQYQFVLDRARPVVLTAQSPDFYQTLELSSGGTVVASTTGSAPIRTRLNAGTYVVKISSESRGETGSYSVLAQRGPLSQTHGLLLGMSLAAGSTSFGNVGGSASQGELHAGLGFGDYVTVLAQYGSSADGNVEGLEVIEYGARGYLFRPVERLRPFVQVMTGSRTYYYDDGSITGQNWKGKGLTIGAGAEWFLDPRIGVEAALFRTAGSMTLDEAPGSPAQSLSQVRLSLGMNFHK